MTTTILGLIEAEKERYSIEAGVDYINIVDFRYDSTKHGLNPYIRELLSMTGNDSRAYQLPISQEDLIKLSGIVGEFDPKDNMPDFNLAVVFKDGSWLSSEVKYIRGETFVFTYHKKPTRLN